MKFKGFGLTDASTSHLLKNFTKDKDYPLLIGKSNLSNPLFKDIWRADEQQLMIDDKGEVIWLSNNAKRKYFI